MNIYLTFSYVGREMYIF